MQLKIAKQSSNLIIRETFDNFHELDSYVNENNNTESKRWVPLNEKDTSDEKSKDGANLEVDGK